MNDATAPPSERRIGEVVEASTAVFASQCYELYGAPPLGSLVRTVESSGDDTPIYGIVYEVASRSIDPARHPIARGRDEDTVEDVYLSNPQISRLLQTEFQSILVGHRSNSKLHRYPPPLPPRIYSFVYRCSDDELRTFSDSLEFIPLLLGAPTDSKDEVVASFLRLASESHAEPDEFLIGSGKELAAILSGQLQRLNILLRRLSA